MLSCYIKSIGERTFTVKQIPTSVGENLYLSFTAVP